MLHLKHVYYVTATFLHQVHQAVADCEGKHFICIAEVIKISTER